MLEAEAVELMNYKTVFDSARQSLLLPKLIT